MLLVYVELKTFCSVCPSQADGLLKRWRILCYFKSCSDHHPQLKAIPKQNGFRRVVLLWPCLQECNFLKNEERQDPEENFHGKIFRRGSLGGARTLRWRSSHLWGKSTPTLEGSPVVWPKFRGRKRIWKKKFRQKSLHRHRAANPSSTQLVWNRTWSVPLLTSLGYSIIFQ